MKKKLLFMMTICSLLSFTNAGIGIAVVKNKKGSSLKYEVKWVEGAAYKAEKLAKQALKDQGHTKISTLTGGVKRGHDLNSGYWVVVKATHKIYDGTAKTSYGLGEAVALTRRPRLGPLVIYLNI